jgi:hypothetical protein
VIIAIEVAAVYSFFVVMGLQRPGVKSVAHARRTGTEMVRDENLARALEADRRFGALHPTARLFYRKGLIPFGIGLGIVLAASPRSLSPNWINSLLIGLGFAIQILATLAFDICGVWKGIFIRKEVRRSSTLPR